MKIKSKLSIVGHNVRVIVKESVTEDDGSEQIGLAYLNQDIIEIAEKHGGITVSESTQAETFIHEIMHFVDEAMNLKMTEEQVTGMARGMLQVIRDNKLDFRIKKEKLPPSKSQPI